MSINISLVLFSIIRYELLVNTWFFKHRGTIINSNDLKIIPPNEFSIQLINWDILNKRY